MPAAVIFLAYGPGHIPILGPMGAIGRVVGCVLDGIWPLLSDHSEALLFVVQAAPRPFADKPIGAPVVRILVAIVERWFRMVFAMMAIGGVLLAAPSLLLL